MYIQYRSEIFGSLKLTKRVFFFNLLMSFNVRQDSRRIGKNVNIAKQFLLEFFFSTKGLSYRYFLSAHWPT